MSASRQAARFVPIVVLREGDRLPAWGGVIVAIRDTPRRRYITIRPDSGGSERTDFQDRQTQIFAEILKGGGSE